jgi:hypothetical protein
VTRDRSAIFSDHVTTRVVYDGAHHTGTVVIQNRYLVSEPWNSPSYATHDLTSSTAKKLAAAICVVSESCISSSYATPDLAYREESGGRDLRIP